MIRVDHWERLLAAAIDTARAKPFVWGVHDCPTFAFETRMILTGGKDIAALWRGALHHRARRRACDAPLGLGLD